MNKMIKEIKIRLLLNEIEKFINEFEDEFEFIVDINDIDKWDIDFDNRCFMIEECCSVSVRENDDKELEKWIKEDDLVSKKVKINNYILYIVM
jgi:hypothetical protein